MSTALQRKLALEIRGKVYVPFVRLQESDTKIIQRERLIISSGKSEPDPGNIELYKGGEA